MNKYWDFIRETYRNKTVPRILMNWMLHDEVGALEGDVLDIGGGSSSYERYLDLSGARLVTTNIDASRKPTVIHDFNAPLPFKDASFDAVMLINVIHILRDPAMAAREIFRVLRPGGRWVLTVPFMFNESKEPEDFQRYTAMGIRRLLDQAGFGAARIDPLGGKVVAAETFVDFRIPTTLLRVLVRGWAMLLDRTLFRKLNRIHPAPNTYFVVASKPS